MGNSPSIRNSPVLGFFIGLLSGAISTIYLGQLDALLRPPFVFWACYVGFWLLARKDFPKWSLALLPLFLASYSIAFLGGGFAFTAMMSFGAILTFASIAWVHKLRHWVVWVIGLFFVTILGLVCDLWFESIEGFFTHESLSFLGFRREDAIAETAKMMIFIWQVVVMTTIGFQFPHINARHQR